VGLLVEETAMTKNRSAILFLILLSLALVAMADLALGEATGTDQAASAPVPPPPPHPARPHHPPKDLKFVDGHWTPYDPPKVPEGANAYTIVPGDTLWDLSGKFLGNTWLWPQLWDNNRYIRDSHWIYPGDPLLIPAAPTVVPPPGEAAPVAAGEEEEAAAAAAEETAAFERPGPLADKEDLYCSSYDDSPLREPEHYAAALARWPGFCGMLAAWAMTRADVACMQVHPSATVYPNTTGPCIIFLDKRP